MISNGAQSEFQALAKAICGVTGLRLYDIDSEPTRKCRANLCASGMSIAHNDRRQPDGRGASSDGLRNRAMW